MIALERLKITIHEIITRCHFFFKKRINIVREQEKNSWNLKTYGQRFKLQEGDQKIKMTFIERPKDKEDRKYKIVKRR